MTGSLGRPLGMLWVHALLGALLAGMASAAFSQPAGTDSIAPPAAPAQEPGPIPGGSVSSEAPGASLQSHQQGLDDGSGALSEHDALLFALPTTHDHIGRVVVPVMVNGRGPFRFIVDTGANHSTISPDLVQTLGLKTAGAPSVVLDGITGTARVTFVTIERLQAGDLTINESALPVVWAPVMAGADGILGAAGLAGKTLVVDFQRNRVVIAHTVGSSMRSEATRIRALRLTQGLITLETKVGRIPVRAVLDTGSERTLGNLALRNALNVTPTRGQGVAMVTSVYGATKEVEEGEIRRAPTISIEGFRINDVAIVYGGFHIFKVWEMEDKPAMIIGMDVLGTVASLGIDFKNQEVYLASVRGNNTPFALTQGQLSDQMQKK